MIRAKSCTVRHCSGQCSLVKENCTITIVIKLPLLQTHNLVEEFRHLQQDSCHSVDGVLQTVLQKLKTSMKKKYESLFEGIKADKNRTLLNRIYTQLYIIEGESEGVNEEHEVLQMEKTPRTHLQDSQINCSEIFKPLQGSEQDTEEENIKERKKRILKLCKENVKAMFKFKGVTQKESNKDQKGPKVQKIRTVMTKGIAGIGKTVSVQKFILDWAEGTANQDVDFMFVLPFRELNLIKDHQYSLHGLLCDFHPELKDLDPQIYDQIKAVFIFDGLDESRIPLNFKQYQKVSDITMTSSVGVLMTNLIRGDLLPSALVWITSRPAAANQIPPKYINRVTEIQGFSDPQKEEYFRKRISDEDQAERIISHIKTARSLHIMCHIPVFCWISATVLQQILKHRNTDIPTTLTEMYLHFLLTQINMKNEKYEEKEERDPEKLLESNRTVILKLAELAFKQLMEGNIMFYEEDLKESSIDVTEAAVYSGIFTELFREECVLHQRKVYCFVHLSFQEFLAAVYVYHCYEIENVEVLQIFKPQDADWSQNVSLDELLIGAVDKAVENQNGHLDLFLRFLLGISLESNQRLLQGLLTPTQSNIEKTREYIKKVIKGDEKKESNILSDRSINLFLCLSEMNDQSLSKEIEEYLQSEKQSQMWLAPGHCSALACMLLISEEVLDELDLRKYNTSKEGYRRLVPAVAVSRKAILINCDLTMNSYVTLCSVLQSSNSPLKELDLSNNYLYRQMEVLCAGLKSSHCKLEKLRLSGCNLTKDCCEFICSALQSTNLLLRELDLSYNYLQDSGVELLSAGWSSHCKLKTLRLGFCHFGEKACKYLRLTLQSANSSLQELDLSNNGIQDSGVKLLSAGLKSLHCKLETLRLSGCMVTDEGCSYLASALRSKSSHLRELGLTYNNPGESGVKLLSDLLKDPHCKLQKLQLGHRGKIRMKPGMKKYLCDLTLDPHTAHPHLSLSDGNRRVTHLGRQQSDQNDLNRFKLYPQVLFRESLTGRCYWEVEYSEDWCSRVVDIVMAYKSISRKQDSDCEFVYDKDYWTLECAGYGYTVLHSYSYNESYVCANMSVPRCYRVGVYLDWAAGILSFYAIYGEPLNIHTFYTKFTEPLYAGFWLYDDYSVRVCEIKELLLRD